ncbi:rhodanese-like domain-containing protein [Sneathiella sp. P13V-1]|uniref:rhodanese-like domain-containing protein n=1 Tax=Sneathiella sp. P13V-1 TaxID=2697366 RepID=UPI001D12D743|nr:rhodanese-like domain-containing protein [Sneathiella sp. P13V-1]
MTDMSSGAGSAGYAGDITPNKAWQILEENPDAVLIDVRTTAEWTFVGVPNLTSLDKKTHLISWSVFPDMHQNPHFTEELEKIQPKKDAPILMLCRSGARSISAAIAATQAGYSAAFNILEGFEGDKDANGHRGQLGGWKKHGLDWAQN